MDVTFNEKQAKELITKGWLDSKPYPKNSTGRADHFIYLVTEEGLKNIRHWSSLIERTYELDQLLEAAREKGYS